MGRDDPYWHKDTFQTSGVFSHDFKSYDRPVSTLNTCRGSREVAQRLMTEMAVITFNDDDEDPERKSLRYINTLHNIFVFTSSLWWRFKIFVDLLNKTNLSTPFSSLLQQDLDSYTNIRQINVDFNIFAGVPAIVWSNFPKLEVLTIGFRPFQNIDKRDGITNSYLEFELSFVKLLKGGPFEKRARWLHTAVTNLLEATRAEVPGWVLPKVSIGVVSFCGIRVSRDTWGRDWSSSPYCDKGFRVLPEHFVDGSELPRTEADSEIPDVDRTWCTQALEMLEAKSQSMKWKAELEHANDLLLQENFGESRRSTLGF